MHACFFVEIRSNTNQPFLPRCWRDSFVDCRHGAPTINSLVVTAPWFQDTSNTMMCHHATRCKYVLRITGFFPPINIKHTQCPCPFSILEKDQSLRCRVVMSIVVAVEEQIEGDTSKTQDRRGNLNDGCILMY